MAFVALDRNNPKTRYAIRMFDDPHVELVGNEFVCQACGYPMFVRGGTENVRFHFAHFPGYPTTCPYFAHERMGDDKHDAGKAAVMAYLVKFEQYAGSVMAEEFYIAPRIADVLVTRLSGRREIHEVQLSTIHPDELLERTRDYNKAGIDFVVWWLGGPMLAASNIDQIRNYFAGSNTRIEYADWPALLNRRHLWPEEVDRLRELATIYGWTDLLIRRFDLSTTEATYRQLTVPIPSYQEMQ
jgi:competence CoiA-like predicted nuclease